MIGLFDWGVFPCEMVTPQRSISWRDLLAFCILCAPHLCLPDRHPCSRALRRERGGLFFFGGGGARGKVISLGMRSTVLCDQTPSTFFVQGKRRLVSFRRVSWGGQVLGRLGYLASDSALDSAIGWYLDKCHIVLRRRHCLLLPLAFPWGTRD